jgi:hypothetical protein
MSFNATFALMANKVGFKPQDITQYNNVGIPPEEPLAIWTSPYAALLLWSPRIDALAVEQLWKTVQACFDRILLDQEKDGKGTFDGFMIVVLKEPPSPDMIAPFSKIQSDTAVCRKHILWPGKNGHTDIEGQLLELTPLGLPKVDRLIDAAQLPGLDATQRAFVEEIEHEKSGMRVADKHLKDMGWQLKGGGDEAE